jgi:hypothetical protein
VIAAITGSGDDLPSVDFARVRTAGDVFDVCAPRQQENEKRIGRRQAIKHILTPYGQTANSPSSAKLMNTSWGAIGGADAGW